MNLYKIGGEQSLNILSLDVFRRFSIGLANRLSFHIITRLELQLSTSQLENALLAALGLSLRGHRPRSKGKNGRYLPGVRKCKKIFSHLWITAPTSWPCPSCRRL